MAKKQEPKPIQLKEVKITAKRKPQSKGVPDSTSVGYGAGRKKFADRDIKDAVKAKQLKNVDTSSKERLEKTVKGNSDKADMVSNAIMRTKVLKKDNKK